MKIKMINCPCCGAQLNVDEKTKRSQCRYCGTHFYIEDDEIGVCEESDTTGYSAGSESIGVGYSSGYAGHFTPSDAQAEQENANFLKVEKAGTEAFNKHNGWMSSDESGAHCGFLRVAKYVLAASFIVLLSFVLINSHVSYEKSSKMDTKNVVQKTDVSYCEDFSDMLEKAGIDVSGWDANKVTNMSAMFTDTTETEEDNEGGWSLYRR